MLERSCLKNYTVHLLKLLMRIVCLSGLLVQTYWLFNEYMSGRTIVNILFKGMGRQTIPSFTICYPCYMSIEKAAQLNPELNLTFKGYKSIIDSKSWDDKEYNDTNTDILYKLYLKAYNTIGRIHSKAMPVINMFEELSLPSVWTNGTDKRSTIKIKVHGMVEGSEGFPNYINIKDNNPIESLASEYDANCIRKCFTYFSALNEKWRGVEMEVDYIEIHVRHHNYWFPPNIFDRPWSGIFVAMHSPNTLPNFINGEDFLMTETQKYYLLTYSRINTKLLDYRYDTNCREYDLDDHKSHVNMRSDCFSLCILEAMKKECLIDCVFQTEALLRKQLFIENRSSKYCHYFKNQSINDCLAKNVLIYKSLCNKKCQLHCSFSYYDWELKYQKNLDVSKWNKQVYINVKHNRLPDQIIEHFPETNFISFISSFGGLLGMWLGMSVLSYFDIIYQFLLKHIP